MIKNNNGKKGEINMNNEIKIFSNEEFGSVRTVMVNNEPYFVGKDVAEILGYKNTRDALSKHINIEDKSDIVLHDGKQNRSMKVINESGLLSLITNSKNVTRKQKENVISFFKENNLLKLDYFINSRKEIEFINKLEKVLFPLNIKLEKQYNILDYRLDGYIPKLNIAIEYDENDHKDYTYEKQELRQTKIEKELNCKFIRLSDRNDDEYNIGLVIKEIMGVR